MGIRIFRKTTTGVWMSALFVTFLFLALFAKGTYVHAQGATGVESADLTAGLVSPITATLGVPTTLSALITNIAPYPSDPFPVLFQIQETGDLINSSYISVAGSDSMMSSVTHTFPSVGTYTVRACANFNTSWVNIATESDYSNNCGDWRVITVSSGQPDLTPGSGVTSFSATAGVATTLSDEIRNIGTVSTGAGFTDIFQKATDASGTGAVTIGTYVSAAIQNGTANNPTLSYTFPTAGTFYIRICADSGSVISESNEGNNCGDWHQATVAPGGTADLTAGSVSPTSATVGTPTTLQATAFNIGDGVSDHFPVLFQVNETGALINSAYVSAIPAGDSAPSSASYTFPSVGTYTVRACANFNTSWVNIATESNYGNNCGDWSLVTVSAAQPSLTCTVSNQNPQNPPAKVTYTAVPAGGAVGPYVWDDSLGGVYGDNITLVRFIADYGKWPMSVKGSNTAFVACPLVTVGDTSCSNPPPPTGSITAYPPRIRSGNTTTISWTLQRPVGAVCSITGPGVNISIPVIDTCTGPIPLYEDNAVTPVITTQAIYKIVCDGTEIARTVVNVLPNFVEF